jgi:alpha-galactosidase
MNTCTQLLLISSLAALAPSVDAVSVTPEEQAEARQWSAARFGGAPSPRATEPASVVPAVQDPLRKNAPAGAPLAILDRTELPFSFVYDGEASAALLPGWKLERRQQDHPPQSGSTAGTAPASAGVHELTWTDARTGLQVRCVAVEYADFPTVEWTLHFRNTGTNLTPILSDVSALDTALAPRGGREYLLHHHKGTFVRADDFEPLTTTLKPNGKLRFAPPAGRPLGHVFPYFNIEFKPDEGVIAVIGWPGQWFAEFARDQDGELRIVAGQENVHLRLKPGEEIRSPLVVVQFWRGDWIRAQNVWRRWMFAHNVPRPGDQPLAPQMAACSSHQYGEMINANEANQMMFVDRYVEEKLPLDYWWMDAGWYWHGGGGWPRTGTWEVDTERFPRGLRAISDHARAKGIKTIVWFEPERVTPGTFLYTNNPAWLLGKDGEQKLLNLGRDEARRWLVGHMSQTIREQGIDLYRQDYNIDPLNFWRDADTSDRQGVTENHYVTGYLAYWDELLGRHPGLLIDTCASGGHRNDLETLRRSVPLLRSDYIMEPVGQQGHTYGLALWLPFYGTGTSAMDPYHFRSQMCPHFTACFDMRRSDLPFDEARRLLAQWKRDIAPNYLGDYYPLTPYTTANDAWLAWQFDRPESGQGLVQAFRRADSLYESVRLPLYALDARARYAVSDLDHPDIQQEFTGAELAGRGLRIVAPGQPAAIVITYRKVN